MELWEQRNFVLFANSKSRQFSFLWPKNVCFYGWTVFSSPRFSLDTANNVCVCTHGENEQEEEEVNGNYFMIMLSELFTFHLILIKRNVSGVWCEWYYGEVDKAIWILILFVNWMKLTENSQTISMLINA